MAGRVGRCLSHCPRSGTTAALRANRQQKTHLPVGSHMTPPQPSAVGVISLSAHWATPCPNRKLSKAGLTSRRDDTKSSGGQKYNIGIVQLRLHNCMSYRRASCSDEEERKRGTQQTLPCDHRR
jgi:hypothetical protein